MMPLQSASLRELLDYLAAEPNLTVIQWQQWTITPVRGGWNNLLYRVAGPMGEFAVKFTRRDDRDRAGREEAALRAIQQVQLSIAPQAVLLEQTRYKQPVVVQQWVRGPVNADPPATDAEWQQLLEHLLLVHSITPDTVTMSLPNAFLNAQDAGAAIALVETDLARIPLEEQPQSLKSLKQALTQMNFPNWTTCPLALCRIDCNPSNFIRRSEGWLSVDWENSGWSDPAFDVALLLTHMAYIQVSASRWRWLCNAYCASVDDPTASLRIAVYYKIMLVWVVVRLARYLYEIPRRLDERLVTWPEDWQENTLTKYHHFLTLAEEELKKSF